MSAARLSPRRLTRNWQLKLAAVALAVLLWALVRAEQPTEQWVRVAIEPQVLDPDYELRGEPDPATVQVRFAGTWRELGELALDKPVLVIHIRNVGRQRTFVLEPSMVRLPDGVRGRVNAIDVRPGLVRLTLERVATREPDPAPASIDTARAPLEEPRDSVVPVPDTAAEGDTFPPLDTLPVAPATPRD